MVPQDDDGPKAECSATLKASAYQSGTDAMAL